MLELDHIVIACTDLDSGEAWLRERLGVPLAPGGTHAGWGTHNRLLQLGGGMYLELIAPDPAQPDPATPRPFLLDDPAMRAKLARSPRLVHWLVRSTGDIDATLATLRYSPGTVSAMSRGTLRWRITLPAGGRPAADGLLPTVIAWDIPADQHPAARLPDAGVRLAGLEVRAPAAVLALRPDVHAPVPIDWVESDTPGLAMTLDTPAGRTTIGSPLA